MSSQEIDKALMHEGVVLAYFSAPWCGPCRMLSPLIDQVAEEVKEFAKVVKVDVEKYNDLAGKYHVKSVPTMLFLCGGVVLDQINGTAGVSKAGIVAKLKNIA